MAMIVQSESTTSEAAHLKIGGGSFSSEACNLSMAVLEQVDCFLDHF
jgi:hypothetical protein